MECLTERKIQEYVDGELNSVENAMARDHIIVCDKCRRAHSEYERLEKFLLSPVDITPPVFIEQNVLRALFPKLPTYTSILASIAASFVLLVTSTYIYFDFSNNSLVQAFNLTSSNTSTWIGSIIRFISSVFTLVYTVFKALNRLSHVLFDVNIGMELIGFTIISLGLAGFYLIYRTAYKKLRN
jgi:hypothetical protein